MSFDVQTGTENTILFEFSDALHSRVKEYRYDAADGRLTIYLSGSQAIFTEQTAEIGWIRLSAAGNGTASVRLRENSLQVVNSAFGASQTISDAAAKTELTAGVNDAQPDSDSSRPGDEEKPVVPDSPSSSSGTSADSHVSGATQNTGSTGTVSSAGSASYTGSVSVGKNEQQSSAANSQTDESDSRQESSSETEQARPQSEAAEPLPAGREQLPIWMIVFFALAGAATAVVIVLLIRRSHH